MAVDPTIQRPLVETPMEGNSPTGIPSNFTVRDNMFPSNRPDVLPSNMQAPVTKESLNPIYTVSQAVDMEIMDMVMSRYELSKTWRRMKRLIWDKCWQNMKGVYDTANKAKWQSVTFQHLTSKVVEVIASNLHSALLAPEMPVEYQTERTDLDESIGGINSIIGSDFKKCFAKAQLTDFIRNLCVCGTAIGEVGYLKQTETVMVKEQQQQFPPQMSYMMKSLGVDSSTRFVPKAMLVKDYATITNCDIYDIYPEPRTAEFSKDHWVIHKTKITNRELVLGARDKDPYYKFDNITDSLLEGSGINRVDQDPEKQTRRFALLDYNVYTHFLDPDREHDLYTYYGMIPLWYLQPEIRRDRSRQYDAVPGCIKVVDGQYVIWKRLSPWRDGEPPYFKGNYIRIPGEFYGIGPAELVMGYQTEKNEIRNSRMDNINLSMNKIVAVLKDLIPSGEWKRLVSEPGALWMIKGVDDVHKAIQTIEFGDITKDSWMASAEIDKEAEEVTAANSVTQASGGQHGDAGGGTFRGQMLNIQQATGRWMLYARLFEWMGLIPAMKKFYARIYQFKDLNTVAEILGQDRMQKFQLFTPEDLDKIATLVPLGVMTMENKGVMLAQMQQMWQAWNGKPWFKELEFARKEYMLAGNPEPDSVLFTDQEQQQYNQFQQQQILMQSQLAASHGRAQGMMAAQGQQPSPGGPPSAPGSPPQGLLGPNGQPMPQTGQGGGVPGGQPVAGTTVGPAHGMPRPAHPARGPGASRMDLNGRPVG